ncbi:MFS transporter, partial [Bacillus sp. AFS075960]
MQTRSTLDEHATAALPAPARTARHHLLAGWASMAGTTIEWYAFYIYGT